MSVKLAKPHFDKPLSDKPTCLDCEYCFEGQIDPNTMKKQSICRLNPPVSYPIPAQGGIAMITVFPNVTKDMVCYQYQEMKRILN